MLLVLVDKINVALVLSAQQQMRWVCLCVMKTTKWTSESMAFRCLWQCDVYVIATRMAIICKSTSTKSTHAPKNKHDSKRVLHWVFRRQPDKWMELTYQISSWYIVFGWPNHSCDDFPWTFRTRISIELRAFNFHEHTAVSVHFVI